jgi:hypothetical protein
MDEEIDVEATKRVAHRALISAVIAFVAVGPTIIIPSQIVQLAFLTVALLVGGSAARTLLHRDAAVIGGLRWLGIVLAAIAALSALLMIVGHLLVLLAILRR